MRIVIDMQGAQTESRFRGIGRYTLSLAQAIVRNRGKHEILLALSGLFPDTIEPIRAAFDRLLPQGHIRVWHAPGPVLEKSPGNDWRREIAERMREAFLASLRPDVLHVASLFEGIGDDAVTSIGVFAPKIPTVVTIHDLIPLLNPEIHLHDNPAYESFYKRKIKYLQRADRWLAVSNSSAREGKEALALPAERVSVTYEGCDAVFRRMEISENEKKLFLGRFGITQPFLLHSGSAEARKNIPRLIRAYAELAPELQAAYQLVLVGKIAEGEVTGLRQIAQAAGIQEGRLLFAGYVPDAELAQFYNLCTVFVFPSWHEGFGLPPLEAMSCGAAVLGAHTTSLPEVIGRPDALFDPYDEGAIARKITEVLTREDFRRALERHSLEQAKKFSWDESARRAIAVFEALHSERAGDPELCGTENLVPDLTRAIAAIVPPGISEGALMRLAHSLGRNHAESRSKQLFVDVSELVHRDSKTGVQRVTRSILKELLERPPEGFVVRPVYATLESKGYFYARQFTALFLGRSPDPQVQDELIDHRSGDLFLGLDLQHHTTKAQEHYLASMHEDGVSIYFLVHDLLPLQFPHYWLPSLSLDKAHHNWLQVITRFDGVVCVSRTVSEELLKWVQAHGPERLRPLKVNWSHNGADVENSIPTCGLPDDAAQVLGELARRPTFLTVGTLEPRKRQAQVLDAFERLWREGDDVNLVVVGAQGWMVEVLVERLRHHPELNKRLFWLEGISDEYLEKIYAAATCLIAASEGEGFGLPLIEAAQHQLPILARDIPVFREVAGEHALFFNGLDAQSLVDAVHRWLGLNAVGEAPRSAGMPRVTWRQSARRLIEIVTAEAGSSSQERPRLFVDLSELVQRDAGSGIQRVTRSVLKELFAHPPAGYQVEPVYATVDQEYRYAWRFAARFCGVTNPLTEGPVDGRQGDIFLGLDLKPRVVISHKDFFEALRAKGVEVCFMVYDLLPIRLPQMFPEGAKRSHEQWLETIAQVATKLICISRSVADELREWLKLHPLARLAAPVVDSVHLGADIESSFPSSGMPGDADNTLRALTQQSSFLMVGTLEPRKGHTQVLRAFELLWSQGVEVRLVIVGKQGWMVDPLAEKLRRHGELNRRLFWLEGISDEYLEKIYAASTCLIAASEGEGFGLPLIEAARHQLPILARDIPAFREVAGAYALFFSGLDPQDFVDAITGWLRLNAAGRAPQSTGMPWMTWQQSVQRLVEVVTAGAGNNSPLDPQKVV